MKVGDLVWDIELERIGIVVEWESHEKGCVVVYGRDGKHWAWKSQLEVVNESR